MISMSQAESGGREEASDLLCKICTGPAVRGTRAGYTLVFKLFVFRVLGRNCHYVIVEAMDVPRSRCFSYLGMTDGSRISRAEPRRRRWSYVSPSLVVSACT